jgi:hypothetical protein
MTALAESEMVSGVGRSRLRGTGSFDWTVEDVFLPERRTMPQIGIRSKTNGRAGPVSLINCRCPLPLASTYTADSAREATDLVYHHGGSTSFKRASRLAEWLRDLHTVGQTVTLAPEWYPIGGRVYLGLDPGPRLR